MPLFRRLLVPTDLTGCATMALRHAIKLTHHTQAELHLLHVLEEIEGGDLVGLSPLHSVYDRLREVVAVEMRLATREAGGAGLPVKQHVTRGVGAAPVILDYADEHDVDLIVLGTHGRQGAERFQIGSTAERVVRFADCPVLTVGPRGGWLPGMVRRVVATIGFSSSAKATVRWARALAGHYSARLDLLHVIEPVIQPVLDARHASVFSFQGRRMDHETRKGLERLYQRAGGPSPRVRYHVRRGRPAREIVRFAEEEQSNLIVQGTCGLSDRRGAAMLGSVAEKVVRGAPCPVFTSRQQPVLNPRTSSAAPASKQTL